MGRWGMPLSDAHRKKCQGGHPEDQSFEGLKTGIEEKVALIGRKVISSPMSQGIAPEITFRYQERKPVFKPAFLCKTTDGHQRYSANQVSYFSELSLDLGQSLIRSLRLASLPVDTGQTFLRPRDGKEVLIQQFLDFHQLLDILLPV